MDYKEELAFLGYFFFFEGTIPFVDKLSPNLGNRAFLLFKVP